MTLPPGDVARLDLIAPLYREMQAGGWIVRRWPDNIPLRGYWSGVRPVSGVASLDRGSDTWMSLMPVEIESQEIGISCAAGHVAIMGLGMGWAAAATALRPEVTAVTVVERDVDLIALHAALDLFGRLPDGAGAKVRIVASDAFDWSPDAPVDLLMPDIWLNLVGGDRIGDVRRMQQKIGAQGVYFWGQELELARHAVAAGRERLEDAEIVATAAELGLPLAGLDTPDYAARLRAAAGQWMNDAWLDERRPAFA
ncbi:MAG: hypothetical protein JO013_16135 [Alphaproteobacteria bacterium]|nr:hypothetical protein [Alphaproteobacteria bacterium]